MAEEQEMNEQNQEDGIRDFSAPPSAASSSASSENLRVLENIDVQLSVEVGNTEIKIRVPKGKPKGASKENTPKQIKGKTKG